MGENLRSIWVDFAEDFPLQVTLSQHTRQKVHPANVLFLWKTILSSVEIFAELVFCVDPIDALEAPRTFAFLESTWLHLYGISIEILCVVFLAHNLYNRNFE